MASMSCGGWMRDCRSRQTRHVAEVRASADMVRLHDMARVVMKAVTGDSRLASQTAPTSMLAVRIEREGLRWLT
jgi:hypothetical protein